MALALIVFLVAIGILEIFVYLAAQAQEQLASEVLHDKLTGLPNNRYFLSSFFAGLQETSAPQAYWVSIIDLDDFKSVNDTYGHNCGDYVLCEVANVLSALPRGIGVCRWGGEEFLIAGKTAEFEPRRTLQGVCDAVSALRLHFDEADLTVTFTIGAAYFGRDLTIDEWVAAADKNLYVGKRQGKNQVVI